MPVPESERLAAVPDFLLRYADDSDAGQARDLAHYQALYPGFEADLAAEYLRLTEPGATDATRTPALEQLGPYRITREVGVGGQAIVYEAEDERLGRTVALKIYTARNPEPRLRRRLEREARTAARIDHPNVCTVFEAHEHDGVLFLAMEFVPGETLAQWIERQRTEPKAQALQPTSPRDAERQFITAPTCFVFCLMNESLRVDPPMT